MSGIIAPSIFTYNWQVKINDPSYVSISFPFRVKIQSIWFTNKSATASDGLWTGFVGDPLTSDRKLAIAGIKSKNAKNPVDQYDVPNDFGYFFGGSSVYLGSPDESLKPTMWLGNPDDANGEIGAFSASSGFFYQTTLRSNAKSAPEPNDPANPTMTNPAWTESEFLERGYKTDMAVMNVDEMLHLFVYNKSGNWDGYTDEGDVTIFVSYTGMWDESAVSAPVREFTSWYEN